MKTWRNVYASLLANPINRCAIFETWGSMCPDGILYKTPNNGPSGVMTTSVVHSIIAMVVT